MRWRASCFDGIKSDEARIGKLLSGPFMTPCVLQYDDVVKFDFGTHVNGARPPPHPYTERWRASCVHPESYTILTTGRASTVLAPLTLL
jgi:hypothetical protein